MNNLQTILSLLLKRVSPQAVIHRKIMYDQFSEDEFIKLFHSYKEFYSEDEIRNMWHYYKTNFEKKRARRYGLSAMETKETINVFSALFSYCDNMLLIRDNQILCKYQELITWRELATLLGDDILVAAYVATRYNYLQLENLGFEWEIITKHNNLRLYQILERGISENHFHFWGSIPIFQLSWLSLMNNVCDSKMLRYLNEYDNDRRFTNVKYGLNYEEEALSIQYLQAAYIRILLFSFLTDTKITIGSYIVDYREYSHVVDFKLEYENSIGSDKTTIHTDYIMNPNDTVIGIRTCKWLLENIMEREDMDNAKQSDKFNWILSNILSKIVVTQAIWDTIENNDTVVQCIEKILMLSKVNLGNLYDFIEKDLFNQIWNQITLKNICKILKSPVLLMYYRENLQNVIDGIRANYSVNSINHKKWMMEDYALFSFEKKGKNNSFSGENWLLFSMFRKIYSRTDNEKEYFNLFYAYVLLKENIRSEIVQVNKNVGFANFQKYQSRKGDLIKDEIFHDYDVQKVLSHNLIRKNIRSLEVRITPPNNINRMKKQISDIDKLINPDNKDKVKKRYYYVYHFIKEVDNFSLEFTEQHCRHYKKRKEMEDRAEQIIRFRKIYSETAKRILGIDACSSEIECRPEIFAPAFRYLENQIYSVPYDNETVLPQLRITYHAGEEFLDVVDGLRAIDEALLFFNLNCSDRIGHAVALGIDVEQWYRSKGNCILISYQDYLDNIVWLYGRIVELEIENQEELKDYLRKKFSLLFKTVYEDFIDSKMVRRILTRMKEKYQDNQNHSNYPYGMENYTPKFDIYTYYNAWKLRGDDPELYRKGYFDYDKFSVENEFEYYRINRNFPKNFEIRYMPETSILYFYYHYCKDVKIQGSKRIEVEIKPLYIRGVKAVQKKMQQVIALKGIAIETNPSSNFHISSFRDYSKHPVTEFYNMELETDINKLNECAQLCVSINTDDKGVFSTSLENEYSLIARSLEEMKKEDGTLMYNREQIYNWINKIRKMGNLQSFMNNSKDDIGDSRNDKNT
jgi:hypothetical protein